MYGSSRKVSEQRKAVPKPKPKRVVKVKKAKVEANKRVVKEEERKRLVDQPGFNFKYDVGAIGSKLIVPRTLTGQALTDMTKKFREWRAKNEGKQMTLLQMQRNFDAFARGPPKRAPPARPAPRRPRNGNGNGNGGR